ncbi:MAG: type II secretion system protein N [Betaproteobacteria bacterium]|nr:type II secretion system protein N [Betaproteobacteria bacterium]
MSPERRHWLLGGGAFLLGLAAMAPASLLDAPLQRKLAPGASFQSVAGTVWSGSGLFKPSAAGETIPLSWRFDAGALLRLRLGVHLRADGTALNGSLRASVRNPQYVEIRDADLTADLAQLQRWLPVPALLRAGGALRITVSGDDRVEIAGGEALPVRGNFELAVQQLLLPQWHPSALGNYNARVAASDSSMDVSVQTASGMLTLEGAGRLRTSPAREISFTGTASPSRPGTELATLLSSLGRPGSDGRTRIDYRGPW